MSVPLPGGTAIEKLSKQVAQADEMEVGTEPLSSFKM